MFFVSNSCSVANPLYDSEIANMKVYIENKKYQKAARLGEKLQKMDLTYKQREEVAEITRLIPVNLPSGV